MLYYQRRHLYQQSRYRTFTIHESQLINMPLYYRTPEEVREKEFVKAMYIDEYSGYCVKNPKKKISGPLHHGQISPFI